MPHSYDYISLFMRPFVDIFVSLGRMFQRIGSIDDRFYLSRLNKLFEENEVFIIPSITFLLPTIEVHNA